MVGIQSWDCGMALSGRERGTDSIMQWKMRGIVRPYSIYVIHAGEIVPATKLRKKQLSLPLETPTF